MVRTGLDIVSERLPKQLKGKRIGILCHAPSISSDFRHILDIFHKKDDCTLSAIFGPQHGIFGQTQDNMIEWQSQKHPFYDVPLYSLYGEHRKPTSAMLAGIDILLIDLQDVGARLYTYIWTVKLCMEACSEYGIPVWVLDRPNPVAALPCDGPVLKDEYFTFVGGACIPLCHRMTLGEMALWLSSEYFPKCELNIVWMEGWKRDTFFDETGLPWVLPSPNMPTVQTALVYPGTVLIEALNLSEGRGSTIPFELFGAPFVDAYQLKKFLDERKIPGCAFRVHGFIPTFNKFAGQYCNGIQIHVTERRNFYPVYTALEIFNAILQTTPAGSMKFLPPPYEYEYTKMPFDILAGDDKMRICLEKGLSLKEERERWQEETREFLEKFKQVSAYGE